MGICPRREAGQKGATPHKPQGSTDATGAGAPSPQASTPTSTMYVGAQTPILLQTAKVRLKGYTSAVPYVVARAIMDSGSQRTYVTSHLRDQLNLPTIRTESLCIKTFGATKTQNTSCDVVNLDLLVEGNEIMQCS